jgi:hypothetical protein
VSSARVLAGVVDPGQYLVCHVNAGVNGDGSDDPTARGNGCGDQHCNYEAVAERLSDPGMDTRRHRQHRDGEQPREARNGVVDARSCSRMVFRYGGLYLPPQTFPTGYLIPPHYRVRHDRIDAASVITIRYNSRLHHIGLSKHLRGTHVAVLIDNRDIRVLDRNTGTLIGKLVLDPTRDHQPRGVKCGNSPENRLGVQTMSGDTCQRCPET